MIQIRENTYVAWHHMESVEAKGDRVHVRTASGITHTIECRSDDHANEKARRIQGGLDSDGIRVVS